jgi:uncharacterized protein
VFNRALYTRPSGGSKRKAEPVRAVRANLRAMGGTALTTHRTDDAHAAWEATRPFLERRPVDHTVPLSLLHDRMANARPGRYWWAERDGEVVGFALRTPHGYHASLVPMTNDVADAIADALAVDDHPLPGVIGDAATAARVAGRWTEHTAAAATPAEGQRLYRLGTLTEPAGVPGTLRAATPDDLPLLVEWLGAFDRDTGMPPTGAPPEDVLLPRIEAGRMWIWDDDGPACMATATPPIAGVTRVGAVYTPDARRRRGYAGACVARVSGHLLSDDPGTRVCTLFTQLANPTSNAVYRRLGYEAVAEITRYDFTTPAR